MGSASVTVRSSAVGSCDVEFHMFVSAQSRGLHATGQLEEKHCIQAQIHVRHSKDLQKVVFDDLP